MVKMFGWCRLSRLIRLELLSRPCKSSVSPPTIELSRTNGQHCGFKLFIDFIVAKTDQQAQEPVYLLCPHGSGTGARSQPICHHNAARCLRKAHGVRAVQ